MWSTAYNLAIAQAGDPGIQEACRAICRQRGINPNAVHVVGDNLPAVPTWLSVLIEAHLQKMLAARLM